MREARILPKDAARFLGCSEASIRNGIRQGILPFGTAVQIGGRFQYVIDNVALIEYKRSMDIIRGEGRDAKE